MLFFSSNHNFCFQFSFLFVFQKSFFGVGFHSQFDTNQLLASSVGNETRSSFLPLLSTHQKKYKKWESCNSILQALQDYKFLLSLCFFPLGLPQETSPRKGWLRIAFRHKKERTKNFYGDLICVITSWYVQLFMDIAVLHL